MSQPRYDGWARQGYAAHNNAALTNTNQVFALTRDSTNFPQSSEFPPLSERGTDNVLHAQIDLLEGQFSSIAGGATTLIWHLARRANGDWPILPSTNTVILAGGTAATGSITEILTRPFHALPVDETVGTIYLVARLNAGTAVADFILGYKA